MKDYSKFLIPLKEKTMKVLKQQEEVKIIKKEATIEDIEKEGLDILLGKKVLFICANYFYVGILVGVNTTQVKLKDAYIIFETGPWSDKKYMNMESLGETPYYIRLDAIEGYKESEK